MKLIGLVVLAAALFVVVSVPTAWSQFTIYYNNPSSSNNIHLRVRDVINSANSYCYVAIMALNNTTIRNALVAARNRGVTVRVVTDRGYRWKSGYQHHYDYLVNNGVAVRTDNRTAFMHHKFVVADGVRVITGSMNFTDSCISSNKNNMIRINNSGVAGRFRNEFNEMWAGRFGSSKANRSGNNTVNGSTVRTLFAPRASIRNEIVSQVNTASSNLWFLIFTYTSSEISNAMVARHNAGANVKGVFDAWQASGTWSRYQPMRSAGVDVRRSRGYPGLLHDKFMAINGYSTNPKAITGSANWTAAADTSNDENVLIIHNSTVTNSYRGNAIWHYHNRSRI